MAAVTKIGFDYEALAKDSARWESPEDVLFYVMSGLAFLEKTSGSTDPVIIEKWERWIKLAKQAIDCLEIIG